RFGPRGEQVARGCVLGRQCLAVDAALRRAAELRHVGVPLPQTVFFDRVGTAHASSLAAGAIVGRAPMHNHLERNLIGYGADTPHPQWPGEARIAVSFVLNYEEGGENTILNGDAASEVFLTETPGGTPTVGGRDLSTESMYEYGSRAGFWRIL